MNDKIKFNDLMSVFNRLSEFENEKELKELDTPPGDEDSEDDQDYPDLLCYL